MSKPLTGRSVLYGFVGFFGVIFAANAALMWFAAETYDGAQDEAARSQPNPYKARMAEARAQKALGWQASITHEARGAVTARLVTAELVDDEGRPLSGLDVAATFFSPVQAGEDVTLALAETGSGRYEGIASLPRAGRWQLRLKATDPEGPRFRAEQEIFFKP